MKSLLSILLVLLLLPVALGGCSGDDGYNYGDFNYNLVTYQGYDSGKGAQFVLYGYDDAPAVVLTAPAASASEMKVGQRLLLNYWVNDSSKTGQQTITVKGMSTIFTDTLVQATPTKLAGLKMEPIELQSVWRTADYINFRCKLQYTEDKRQLMLVMDNTTIFDEVVKCYLVHDMLNATTYYWMPTYFSFYLGDVWKLPTCKTVRVYVEDEIYPDVKYYDFSKK